MKQYKLICSQFTDKIENEINKLAKQGYEVQTISSANNPYTLRITVLLVKEVDE